MRALGKILLAASVGQGVYGKLRMQKVVAAVVTAAMLAVIVSVMISVLVIGSIYAFYLILLSQGVGMPLALLTIIMTAIVLTAAVIVAIRRRIRHLRSPISAPVHDVVDAFIDGLMAR